MLDNLKAVKSTIILHSPRNRVKEKRRRDGVCSMLQCNYAFYFSLPFLRVIFCQWLQQTSLHMRSGEASRCLKSLKLQENEFRFNFSYFSLKTK